jgi:anti-anti-sigma factor
MSGETGVVWFLRTAEQTLGAVRLVTVQGRVSHSAVAELSRVLAHHPPGNSFRAVLIDLSGVDYINGAGLRVFEQTADRLKGLNIELLVCGLRPPVHAAFDLAGTMPNLVIMASREAALLRGQRPGEP